MAAVLRKQGGLFVVGWLALLFFCGISSGVSAREAPFPLVAAAYLVKSDAGTLWEREADERLPPASLTKMMTALLVVEKAGLGEEVAVSRAAANETGTRIGLKPGNRMTVGSLLAATLVGSANDACHALADHVAGNEKRFVALMNRRAAEWGLRNTHFVNVCGHDHPDHYSCAHDLAVLAERLPAVPALAHLVVADAVVIQTVGKGRTFHLHNKNALIGRYPGALGVKTGFTPRAGKCLVALAQRRGTRVLLVLLNAPNRWWDAVDILDRAFKESSGET